MRAKCTALMTSRVRCFNAVLRWLVAGTTTMGTWGRKSTKTCLFMKVHFSACKPKNGAEMVCGENRTNKPHVCWVGLGRRAGRRIDDGSFTHQAIRCNDGDDDVCWMPTHHSALRCSTVLEAGWLVGRLVVIVEGWEGT